MIAPSEKHLEDWLFKNIRALKPYISDDAIVYRQVPTPHGIIDLLIVEEWEMTVVELKKGKADDHALQQVLRYISDLKDTWEDTVGNIPSKPYAWSNYGTHGGLSISGRLIGYSCDNPTLVAAWGVDVFTYLYNFDGQSYSFVEAFPTRVVAETNPLQYSDISDHMIRMARRWIEEMGLTPDGSELTQEQEGGELS